MPPPVFWRKMPQSERAEFDAEIRRRGYGDCHGLVNWLANKGIAVCKSSIHKYERRLRERDESLAIDGLPHQTVLAIVEAVALVLKSGDAFRRALDALRDESAAD